MENSIARMITLLARKSQSYIGSALSKYNITAAEQPFFMAIQHHKGITQEELTALVCVDKAATARAVKSLEKKGFLTREQDEHDRRQNRIYATDMTMQLADAVNKELLRFNELLTQGIIPEDIDVIFLGLQKMEKNFSDLLNGKNIASESRGHKNGRIK